MAMIALAPAAESATPPPRLRRVHRHHWLVRITHWLNALAIIVLLMTGLNIFGAHSRLYWGNAGSVDQRERVWLETGASGPASAPRGWLDIGGTRFDTTGVLGASKSPDGNWSTVAVPHWATLPA